MCTSWLSPPPLKLSPSPCHSTTGSFGVSVMQVDGTSATLLMTLIIPDLYIRLCILMALSLAVIRFSRIHFCISIRMIIGWYQFISLLSAHVLCLFGVIITYCFTVLFFSWVINLLLYWQICVISWLCYVVSFIHTYLQPKMKTWQRSSSVNICRQFLLNTRNYFLSAISALMD